MDDDESKAGEIPNYTVKVRGLPIDIFRQRLRELADKCERAFQQNGNMWTLSDADQQVIGYVVFADETNFL